MKKLFFILLFMLVLMNQLAVAQKTKVRGVVIDKETGELLPFVNVVFKGTTKGTVTDFNGEYFLETTLRVDSIEISFVGYETLLLPVKKDIFQEISVTLVPVRFDIEEITVKRGESPANPIIRKAVERKKQNNTEDAVNSYQYEAYNKIEIDISNMSPELREKAVFNKFEFIFDYVDTSVITGKSYLPVLFAESVTENYYQNRPRKDKELIKASKISGIDNESVSQFLGKMYLKANVYDNFITMFETSFVSPIADFSMMYYNYFLIDSAIIDNDWCYRISFKPKRKQENTFTGNIWINDTTFAVKRVQLRMAEGLNVNFIKELVIEQDYNQLNDSVWALDNDKIFIEFNVTENLSGFFGTKTSHYRDYIINKEPEGVLAEQNTYNAVVDDVMKKNDAFWDSTRAVPLTQKELDIYEMVDSVQSVPLYKTVEDFIIMFVNYYYVVGLFEYGPWFSTYSFNPIEGNRFRVGGRTSNAFSTKIMFDGYVAYGTLDERYKYGGGVIYMFNKNPRRDFRAFYKHDVQQLSQSENAYLEDNIAASLLRRTPNYKLTMVNQYHAFYEHEWKPGFFNTLQLEHKQVFSTPYVPFYIPSTVVSMDDIKSSEISLVTKYTHKPKYVMGEFERVSVGSSYPQLELKVTSGLQGVFQSDYQYFKLYASILNVIEIDPFGYFKFKLSSGKILGDLPYPLLELHPGNETYAYDFYAFSAMNYYEFVSDQYVSFIGEHHFLGLFLNKIPLFRRLKFREVATLKAIAGTLSPSNLSVMQFPDGLNALDEPYVECNAGVENIFRIFRLDGVWRLTHLDHPNVNPFGLRVNVKISF